jgi:hypothetical protein
MGHASNECLPRQRAQGLLSEQVGEDVVVMDPRSGEVHCLTGAAAAVWRLCDGSCGVARIAEIARIGRADADDALIALRELDLLESGPTEPPSVTRRTLARRAIEAGAGALVLSAALPTVASAASGIANGQPATKCTAASGATATDSECASRLCYQTHAGVKICAPAGCAVFNGLCVLGVIPCCAGSGFCTGLITLTCSN